MKKAQNETEIEPIQEAKRAYFFSNEGRTVMATSVEEARAILDSEKRIPDSEICG